MLKPAEPLATTLLYKPKQGFLWKWTTSGETPNTQICSLAPGKCLALMIIFTTAEEETQSAMVIRGADQLYRDSITVKRDINIERSISSIQYQPIIDISHKSAKSIINKNQPCQPTALCPDPESGALHQTTRQHGHNNWHKQTHLSVLLPTVRRRIGTGYTHISYCRRVLETGYTHYLTQVHRHINEHHKLQLLLFLRMMKMFVWQWDMIYADITSITHQ